MGYFRDLGRDMFPKIDEHTRTAEYEDDYSADYYDEDPYQKSRGYKRSGRTLKIAVGSAALLSAIAGIVYATADTGARHSITAEQTPGDATSIDSGTLDSASPSPSETTSESASPSPTHTKKASPSPSQTTAKPTPTTSRVVIPASPSPAETTAAPVEQGGSCHLNTSASSPDYRHREAMCDSPVTAYTESDGATPAFEVNGPVQFDCLDAERGYLQASISNQVGWVALPNLANDICN
jgi:cytoskeletal protein RodZ